MRIIFIILTLTSFSYSAKLAELPSLIDKEKTYISIDNIEFELGEFKTRFYQKGPISQAIQDAILKRISIEYQAKLAGYGPEASKRYYANIDAIINYLMNNLNKKSKNVSYFKNFDTSLFISNVNIGLEENVFKNENLSIEEFEKVCSNPDKRDILLKYYFQYLKNTEHCENIIILNPYMYEADGAMFSAISIRLYDLSKSLKKPIKTFTVKSKNKVGNKNWISPKQVVREMSDDQFFKSFDDLLQKDITKFKEQL